MEATVTSTALNAIATLARKDPALLVSNQRTEPERNWGLEANEARQAVPASAEVRAYEQQRAQVAEQQRQERVAAQSARQNKEQEHSPAQQNSQHKQQQQQYNQNRTWKVILHHMPKKLMGIARAMGLSVDFGDAKGLAQSGVNNAKRVAEAAGNTRGTTNGVDHSSLKPDKTPVVAKQKDFTLAR